MTKNASLPTPTIEALHREEVLIPQRLAEEILAAAESQPIPQRILDLAEQLGRALELARRASKE